MDKQLVQVTLDEELETFLARFRADRRSEAVSLLVNSLLRHERFREGVIPAGQNRISSQPASTSVEQAMLQHSGLLPLSCIRKAFGWVGWLQSWFYLLR